MPLPHVPCCRKNAPAVSLCAALLAAPLLLTGCAPHAAPGAGQAQAQQSTAQQMTAGHALALAVHLLKDENASNPALALDILSKLQDSGEPVAPSQAAGVLRLLALRLLNRNEDAVAAADALLLAKAGALPRELEADVFLERGRALTSLERYGRAREDLDQALRINPMSMDAYLARGDVHFAMGEMEAAEDDYSRAITLAPNEPLAWVNRGVARDEQGHPAEAVADYTEALRLAPNMATAYANRGISLSRLGDFAGMCRDYAAACKRGDCTRLGEAKNVGFCLP